MIFFIFSILPTKHVCVAPWLILSSICCSFNFVSTVVNQIFGNHISQQYGECALRLRDRYSICVCVCVLHACLAEHRLTQVLLLCVCKWIIIIANILRGNSCCSHSFDMQMHRVSVIHGEILTGYLCSPRKAACVTICMRLPLHWCGGGASKMALRTYLVGGLIWEYAEKMWSSTSWVEWQLYREK